MAKLAQTPPMGWNAWNTFGYADICEKVILETADSMVSKGFRDAGYKIVSVDDCWMARERDTDNNLQADPQRFPHGMKFIGDYLHERGLKFGLYEDGGVLTCAGYPGSYGYERQDARKFAEWGVDLLKYDFCYTTPDCIPVRQYRRMGQALRESGRDIIFSGCWGSDGVWKWMRSCGAHMWRLTGDIKDSWDSITEVGLGAVGLECYAGPGGWNDPDMLVVGLDGKGYVGQIGGGSTLNEYEAHFALWCMLSAPLLMGHDIRTTSPEILNILLNKELISINQDDLGVQAYGKQAPGNTAQMLAKPLANGDIAFCLINREDCWRMMPLAWESCGWEISDSVRLRDVLHHEDKGIVHHGAGIRVEGHSAAVFRATRI